MGAELRFLPTLTRVTGRSGHPHTTTKSVKQKLFSISGGKFRRGGGGPAGAVRGRLSGALGYMFSSKRICGNLQVVFSDCQGPWSGARRGLPPHSGHAPGHAIRSPTEGTVPAPMVGPRCSRHRFRAGAAAAATGGHARSGWVDHLARTGTSVRIRPRLPRRSRPAQPRNRLVLTHDGGCRLPLRRGRLAHYFVNDSSGGGDTRGGIGSPGRLSITAVTCDAASIRRARVIGSCAPEMISRRSNT
jgi:hypothetical protein